MLPKELLDVRKVKGKIIPKFAGRDDYELAERIIALFRAGVGKKYGLITAKLREMENARNFKKLRGLARVLENYCVERSCVFGVDSEVDPYRVRMLLFERGFVTSKRERDKAIEYAAKYFRTTPETIERAMYADRDEELILSHFKLIDPDELIKLYNLSLLQTVLFNALRLTFWMSDNHKKVFSAIKRLGLMYELYEDDGKLVVEVSGAASILKMTRKYGVRFARLVPFILQARNWQMRAEIVDGERLYILELDDRMRDIFPKKDEKIEYDSTLEEEFARKMRMLGYNVVREPDVVKSGKYAFIPDFAIDIGGSRVYIEIVGFWTQDYLRKKVEKIKNSRIPLIVLAREEFGDHGEVAGVIHFSSKIPYGELIRSLKKYRRIEVEGDVVEIDCLETLPEEYVLAGKYAIRKEFFEKVKKDFESRNPKTLEEAREILKKYGLGESVLSALGYRVRWIGLGEAILEKNRS